jgi:penicillin-binding protein 1B
MMRDVVDRGTGAKLRQRGFKYNVAGKTGTSRDAWFTGYTPKIVCAVYVGFDNGAELGMTGGDAALPIWEDFMSAALASHPEWTGDWQMPSGVEQAVVDTTTGGLATESSAIKRTELFIAGTAPFAPAEPTDEMLTEGEMDVLDETVSDELAPTPPSISGENSDEDPSLNMPPPPRTRTPPRLEGRGVLQPDGSTRLSGTITLDIDPTTGLLASRACQVTRQQVFQIGTEPKRSCGAAYHNGRTIMPSDSRGRLN